MKLEPGIDGNMHAFTFFMARFHAFCLEVCIIGRFYQESVVM